MKLKKRYFLLTILLLLFGYVIYSTYEEVRSKTITEFNIQQMVVAKQAAKGIESYFNNYYRDLTYLSGIDEIISFDDQGEKMLAAFYNNNANEIRAVTRVDANGRIIYTIPFNKKAIGADISYQDHMRVIMKTHKPVVSDVFKAVQGYKVVVYHVPVFADKDYKGSLAVLIPFEKLSKDYLENLKIGKDGSAWVISAKGVELYSPFPDHIGKTVFETYKENPSVISLTQEMMKGEEGVTTYKDDKIRGSKIDAVTKHAVYFPIRLGNTFWSIVVATPETEVLSTMKGFRNKLFFIVALLLLVGLIYSYFVLRAWAVLKEESKRKQTEAALRESEKKHRRLIENAVMGIYQVTQKGTFIMANQRMAEIFGYASPEDFLTATGSIAELYAYPEEREDILQELDQAGVLSGKEIQFKRKDGQKIWINLNSRVTSDNGEGIIYEDLIEDITEFKKMEAQLQHAQKMEAIGTLAGGIAHDFNNLMMAMLGNISLMLHETEPNHPYQEKLKNIEELIQSGSKLTNQLLGFARKGKYDVKPIPLNKVVAENAETFGRTRKELTIQKNLDKNLLPVMGDESQIQQVLLNLYVNAADAMPGGGDLFLKTANVTHSEMKDKSYNPRPGNYVLLTVTDKGTGIDKKILDRIFDPFFTTKDMGRGTGLGLASVYGIIKGHGGYIDVNSIKGQGTTFRIYLPASEKGIDKTSQISVSIRNGTETILLVDDEEMVLDIGVQMIKKLGYTVLGTRRGREAIEIYEKKKGNIALVILDMVMPTMGGGDTYDRLKKINPDIKVLLSSGYSVDGRATEILERGCDGFIQKPFNLKDLSVKIREILDK